MTDGSPSDLRTVAVVLAGGTGLRVGLDTPKQLLKVAGRTVLEHTVTALAQCTDVDEIVVMMTAVGSVASGGGGAAQDASSSAPSHASGRRPIRCCLKTVRITAS